MHLAGSCARLLFIFPSPWIFMPLLLSCPISSGAPLNLQCSEARLALIKGHGGIFDACRLGKTFAVKWNKFYVAKFWSTMGECMFWILHYEVMKNNFNNLCYYYILQKLLIKQVCTVCIECNEAKKTCLWSVVFSNASTLWRTQNIVNGTCYYVFNDGLIL